MAAKKQCKSAQRFRTTVRYEDVAVSFSQEEWEHLTTTQKTVYQKVMSETFKNLTFVATESKKKSQEPHPGPKDKDDEETPSTCTGVFKGGPLFFCLTCGKCFKKNTFLFNHQFPVRSRRLAVTKPPSRKALGYKPQHRGERPFFCNLCGKTYRDASGLSRHRRAHVGYRPRSCPECGKCFRDQSEVNRHLKVHQNKKPVAGGHLKVHQNKPVASNQKQKGRAPRTRPESPAPPVPPAPPAPPVLRHVKVIQGPVARAKARSSRASTLDARSTPVTVTRPREKVYCPYCRMTFTMRTCLLNHLKIHFRRQPNQHFCCKESHSSNTLRVQKIYNCPVCDSSFRGKESLLNHLCSRRPIRFSKCWEILGHLLGYLREPLGNIVKVRESRKRRRKRIYSDSSETEGLSGSDDVMEVDTDSDTDFEP